MTARDEYSVSVYASPMPLPIPFFVHTYFVLTHHDLQARYELLGFETEHHSKRLHKLIFKDYLPPETGFNWLSTYLFPEIGPRYHVKKLHTIAGSTGSVAYELFDFITSPRLFEYPGLDNYHMIQGPNSNLFTAWVLNQVSGCKFNLPKVRGVRITLSHKALKAHHRKRPPAGPFAVQRRAL